MTQPQQRLDARPHLAGLRAKMDALLELADEAWQRGRANGDEMDYATLERQVASQCAEIECAVHEVVLGSLDIDAAFVKVWGKTYRRVHRTSRAFGTLAGNVTVERTLYREVGKRNGPALDPVAQRAGAVDGSWLPHTARAMAHLLAQVTSREAETTSQEMLRLPYSRSSFERVGHEVGREYWQRRRQVEPKLIEALDIPEQARSISVSIDRVSVPMEEPVARQRKLPMTRQEREAKEHSRAQPELSAELRAALKAAKGPPGKRRPPKIERNYRMAYCATVTLHDGEGKALQTIRYGRMPPAQDSIEAITHREAHNLAKRLCEDVCAIRERRPELKVVLLADGAPELWRLFERHLCKRTLGVEPVKLVDAWHALEYVAAAARLLETRGKLQHGAFRRWKTLLLEQAGGVHAVLRALERAGLREARDEAGKRPVGDAIRYLQSRTARMDYAGARTQGLPIGSGAVEATCKSLVTIRMKRAGSRWKPQTGNEVLTLRALQLSDRWEPAITAALKPLAKSVRVTKAPLRDAI